MRPVSYFLFALAMAGGPALAEDGIATIENEAAWRKATAAAEHVTVGPNGLTLRESTPATWCSRWFDAPQGTSWKSVAIETETNLFANKTIEVIVDGSGKPFVDADGVEHDWYGRCMIAVLDARRWVMAIRSGVNHIKWGDRDAIHLLTSSDEGRTWGKLNHWFDGTPIDGLPYEDGHTHSEPGLYRMPNGDLILQFWRTSFTSGTKQLRSTDDGKSWRVDHDRLEVRGVTEVPGNLAIGTEDWFIDPENPEHVYMAFQYWDHKGARGSHLSGTFLARSTDNGRSYEFLSWIGPLGDMRNRGSKATFEPAIEYVGNRTIVAILRDAEPGASGGCHTWQTVSTDMGRSFGPLFDIADQVDGGIPNGLWQRVRLYKESNPVFWFDNPLDYAKGEGRLWGFGLHSNGGGYTRKPVVYYSDDNGCTWHGPESLHGAMTPGTDTGYGDLKRRTDGTFVAATYFADRKSMVADTEQYTFGGQRVALLVEVDRNGDSEPETDSSWQEIYNGRRSIELDEIAAARWRVKLRLSAPEGAPSPLVRGMWLASDSGRTAPEATDQTRSGAGRRPNVLFIAVDDLRPELRCYGAEHIHSPNLDRLASTGFVFERAYCQQAVCGPSRASLLTGLRSQHCGVTSNRHHFRKTVPEVVTLPQHFKQQGYHTQGMGKLFHATFWDSHDYNDDASWSVEYVYPKSSPLTWHDPKNAELVERTGRRGPPWESPDVPDEAYYDGQLAEMATRAIEALADSEKPFFLGVGFQKPHLPFCAPKRYWDLYKAADIGLSPITQWPKGSPGFAHWSFGEVRSYFGTPAHGPVSRELALKLIHGYYASVSYVDAQIGKVLDALKRAGLEDNTIVVLWGDHGWKLSEYSSWSKATNYELDTRTVLMLRYPGMPNRGGRSAGLVELLDIYPTLCDLAGLPLVEHLEGRTMRPVVENPTGPGKDAVFSQYPRRGLMGYTMRTDEHRLTLWAKDGDRQRIEAVELYEHPRGATSVETVNLATDPAQEETLKRLSERFRHAWPW